MIQQLAEVICQLGLGPRHDQLQRDRRCCNDGSAGVEQGWWNDEDIASEVIRPSWEMDRVGAPWEEDKVCYTGDCGCTAVMVMRTPAESMMHGVITVYTRLHLQHVSGRIGCVTRQQPRES